MDLRVQKTRRSIVNAFLRLRAKKPLEKISVKELSELAEINKATFYLHYKDIYDLSENIENELIENIFSAIDHPRAIISDPKLFTRELADAFTANRSMIDIVFSGDRGGIVIERLEKLLKDFIFSEYPSLKNSPAANILLTFSLKGGYYAVVENADYDMDILLSAIGDISEFAAHRIAEDL